MESSLLTRFFSEPVIQAVFWTLIHSLWTGAFMAGLVAIILLFIKRSIAVLRYRLLCCVLLSFLILTGLIFSKELTSRSHFFHATISVIKIAPDLSDAQRG